MRALAVALTVGMVSCILLQSGSAVEGGKASETVLHSFGSGTDGRFPYGGLIDVNGTLYGTTAVGGAYNLGTVFAVDLVTGAETVIHDFAGDPDGQGPQAGLIDVKGKLYGTTNGGGAYNDGTVFSVDPKTGKERVVYSFCSACGDGENPEGDLVALNAKLYGTLSHGGDAGCQFGCGTVFSLDLKTGKEKTLYAFRGNADGEYPWAGLISMNGMLYGTTVAGGTSGNGTVFAVDLNTGVETVVHSFGSGTDSQEPEGNLVAVNGILYGATLFGGDQGFGTVYSLDPGTGAARVLHSFCGKKCLDGSFPYAGLTSVSGAVYGTTSAGGNTARSGMGCGTAFAVDPATGAEKVVHRFKVSGGDGQEPLANLIDAGGALYGTTSHGGNYDYGTVFALTKH